MSGIDDYCQRTFNSLIEHVRSQAYKDGYEKAKEDYGTHLRGTAHCKKATIDEIEVHGFELFGWCDCGRPIEGRWVGFARFCPFCGRVIEWGKVE